MLRPIGSRRSDRIDSAPPVRSAAALEQFYYLDNFESLLAAISARYSDLLCAEERSFIEAFGCMARGSRALLVRMAMRKGELFRASSLRYPEIGEITAAAAPLLAAGWLEAQPKLHFEQLQQLLTKAELVHFFSQAPRDRQCTKAVLVELLQPRLPGAKSPHAWCPGLQECFYRLTVNDLCERFRLMFFGNFRQDWSDFVLADLGVIACEKIQLAKQSRAFGSRAEIDDFQQLQRCRELLADNAPLDAAVRSLPPDKLDREWLEERRQALLLRIARRHERSGDCATALTFYSRCMHPGARLRVIRLHQRAKRWQAAVDLCERALAAPEDDAERQQLRRLLPRLNRKLGIANPAVPCTAKISSFELVLQKDAADVAVEYQVRNFLAQQTGGDATVHYVENGLVNSLFGLLCWHAIFAPLPGAFFHDFHRAPADLSSVQFYRRREREFAQCFAELESGRYQATIRRTYAAKAGIQSPFVAWNLLHESLLETALACFPAAHLRHWFEWIVHEPRLHGAGFPDLVQFWPRQRRYRLIEIKGPGDRLQDNQQRLLEYCTLREMPVTVCYVRWL